MGHTTKLLIVTLLTSLTLIGYGLANDSVNTNGDISESDQRDREFEQNMDEGLELFYIGEFELALESFQQAAELVDISPPLMGIVFCHEELGDFKAMRSVAEQAFHSYPDEFICAYHYGRSLWFLDLYKEAVPVLETAQSIDPDSEGVYYYLGRANLELDDFEPALVSFDKYLEFDNEYDSVWHYKGECEYNLGLFTEAIKSLERSLELGSTRNRTSYLLADSHQESGNFEEAEKLFRQLVELSPENEVYHLKLGRALKAQGDLEGALACYQKAAELDESWAVCQHNIGISLYHLGRYEECVGSLRRAIELGVDENTDTYKTLGHALTLLKKFEEAEKALSVATELDPNSSTTKYYLGLTYLGLEQPFKAENLIKDAIAMDPTNWLAKGSLGLAYFAQLNWDKAIQSADETLSEMPEQLPDVYRIQPYIVKAFANAVLGEYDQALSSSDFVIENGFDDAKLRAFRALAFIGKGMIKETEREIKASYDLDPENYLAIAVEGLSLIHQDQTQDAFIRFEKYIDVCTPRSPLNHMIIDILTEIGEEELAEKLTEKMKTNPFT